LAFLGCRRFTPASNPGGPGRYTALLAVPVPRTQVHFTPRSSPRSCSQTPGQAGHFTQPHKGARAGPKLIAIDRAPDHPILGWNPPPKATPTCQVCPAGSPQGLPAESAPTHGPGGRGRSLGNGHRPGPRGAGAHHESGHQRRLAGDRVEQKKGNRLPANPAGSRHYPRRFCSGENWEDTRGHHVAQCVPSPSTQAASTIPAATKIQLGLQRLGEKQGPSQSASDFVIPGDLERRSALPRICVPGRHPTQKRGRVSADPFRPPGWPKGPQAQEGDRGQGRTPGPPGPGEKPGGQVTGGLVTNQAPLGFPG